MVADIIVIRSRNEVPGNRFISDLGRSRVAHKVGNSLTVEKENAVQRTESKTFEPWKKCRVTVMLRLTVLQNSDISDTITM
jgi:hypothetical protein